MIISLIAALDDKGGIGFKGGLPWPKNSADLKWFKEVTMGKTLIVGYNTFETLPPLPGRTIRVLKRDYEPVHVIVDLISADVEEAVVIGGAKTYRTWLPYVDRFYISRIRGEFESDTYCEELKLWNR